MRESFKITRTGFWSFPKIFDRGGNRFFGGSCMNVGGWRDHTGDLTSVAVEGVSVVGDYYESFHFGSKLYAVFEQGRT